MIALGALVFAVTVARAATGQIEFGEYEADETGGQFGHGSLFRINPANGLPMNGAIDALGNPYGSDFHSHLRISRSIIE